MKYSTFVSIITAYDLGKHIVDNLQHNILTSYSDLIDSH